MNKILAFLAIFLLTASVYTMYIQPAAANHPNPPNPIIQNNWEVPWSNPSTNDGLAVGNVNTGAPVKYKGANTIYDHVITDARIPSIYVSYPGGPNGTADVLDQLGPASYDHFYKTNAGSTGFRLDVDYYKGCEEDDWIVDPPNGCYRYTIQWSFYSNGLMYQWIKIWGPGFTDFPDNRGIPTYETRWRVNTKIYNTQNDGFAIWNGNWNTKPANEGSSAAVSPYTPEGYKWKIFNYPETGSNENEKLYIVPYGPDAAVLWSLRWYIDQVDIPHEDAFNSIKKTPGEWALPGEEEEIQGTPPNTGEDNVHWYLAQTNYANCSTSLPCVPGANWWAIDFP